MGLSGGGSRPAPTTSAQAPRGRTEPSRDRFMDEVYDFLDINKVDERAREALLTARRDVQESILQRGHFDVGIRNPSAALLARIRDAQNARPEVQQREDPPSTRPRFEDYGHRPEANHSSLSREIDEFILAHRLDDKVADTLKECPPRVQRAAMSRGLTGARNPSAALTAMLRDLMKDVREPAPPAPSTRRDEGPPPPRPREYAMPSQGS
eukprot:4446775-Amphidinium_carterae.1